MGLNNGVVGSKGLEFVWCGLKVGAGHLGDLSGNALSEALESVDSGSDSGSTLSKELEVWEGILDTLDAKVKLGNVAREFLGEGEWSSVLKVSASDFDDLLGLEIVDLLLERIAKGLDGWKESLLNLENSGNVHNSWEGIVGRGGHVNVVVWVDWLLAAHLSSEDLNGAIRDDLVGVHVGLGAGSGLPDNKWEVVDELEVRNLLSCLLDSLSDLWVCEVNRSVCALCMKLKLWSSYPSRTAC